MGKKWKDCEDRSQFENLARQDRDRYNRELQEMKKDTQDIQQEVESQETPKTKKVVKKIVRKHKRVEE